MNDTNTQEVNIGIDTSTTQLDIFIRPHGHFESFENNTQGIQKAITYIRPFNPTRVLIEATGRLEIDFVCAASQAQLPVVVCKAVNVRQFARATGRAAKTDKLDAQDIAHFGEALKPALTALKPENMRLVSDLLTVRSQLLTMSTMQKNTVQYMPKSVHTPIKNRLKALQKEVASIEKKLDKEIAKIPEWQAKLDQLTSVKGVGKVVAYTQLIAKSKPKKVALVACMRKLIVILNTMVRDGTHWDATRV